MSQDFVDRFASFILEKLLYIICVSSLIFVLGSVLAPILAHLGLVQISRSLYLFYSLTSHQRPWRSIHFFDYQMAWDVRMTFIFNAFFFISLIYVFFKFKPISSRILLMLVIPIALDGGIQLLSEYLALVTKTAPFYESTNLRRMITGTLFGTGIGLFVIPELDKSIRESLSRPSAGAYKYINTVNIFFMTLFLCFFLHMSFNFFWDKTSKRYKPSGILDNISRIPGVNYEVTDSGWHSTNPRDTGYWKRASQLRVK